MQPKAPLFKLNWRDLIHGLVVSVFGAVTTAAYDAVNSGQFPHTASDFKTIGGVAAAAGLSYVIKNVFSNSAGNFGQSEAKAPTIVELPKPTANTDTTVKQTTVIDIKK